MKAQDLMVGDWIIVDNEAMQVMPTLIDALFYDEPIKAEPIAIDGAILSANGFAKQPDVPEGLFNYVYNNGGQIVYVSPLPWDCFSIDANFNGRLSMSIQYVHELQHILRLIGINDLADNFKIKEGGLQ